MCEPAYSENNLNFRLGICRNLTLSKKVFWFQIFIYATWANYTGKICPRNDTFSDPRLQRSKHGNNSDRALEQRDMQALGQFSIPETIVVHEDRKSRPKIHCKTMNNFFLPPPERKDNSSCHSLHTSTYHAVVVTKFGKRRYNTRLSNLEFFPENWCLNGSFVLLNPGYKTARS